MRWDHIVDPVLDAAGDEQVPELIKFSDRFALIGQEIATAAHFDCLPARLQVPQSPQPGTSPCELVDAFPRNLVPAKESATLE